MTEYITDYFYSNCFIEAIKAKIRHPFKVKITFVPRSEANCPHFLWSDGENDYDFGVERWIHGIHVLLFLGQIRKRKLGFNTRYKKMMKDRSARHRGYEE